MLCPCSGVDMALSRCRSRPNTSVNDEDYITGVKAWLLQDPLCTVKMRVGPKFATQIRHVNADVLMSTLPLANTLISAGATSGVLQLSKLRVALKRVFSENFAIVGKLKVDDLIHYTEDNSQSVSQ